MVCCGCNFWVQCWGVDACIYRSPLFQNYLSQKGKVCFLRLLACAICILQTIHIVFYSNFALASFIPKCKKILLFLITTLFNRIWLLILDNFLSCQKHRTKISSRARICNHKTTWSFCFSIVFFLLTSDCRTHHPYNYI